MDFPLALIDIKSLESGLLDLTDINDDSLKHIVLVYFV